MIYTGDIVKSAAGGSEYTIYTGDATVAPSSNQMFGRQSNGTFVAVIKSSAAKLTVYNSEDEGETWNVLSDPGLTSSPPVLCIDSNDTIHIVYIEPAVGLRYGNSTDWDFVIIDSEPASEFPSAAVDSNDNIHVVYEKPTEGTSNDDQVAYINSNNGGLTWSGIQVLTDEADFGDDGWWPAIVINSTNTLHVFFNCENYANGNDQILHMYSIDGGTSWTNWESDIITNDDATDQFLSSVIVDSDDYLHLTWFNNTGTGMSYYSYNDSSGWTSGENLSDYYGTEIHSPSISYSKDDGYLHVIVSSGYTYDNLTYIYNDTSSWQPHVNLSGWPTSYNMHLLYANHPNNVNIPVTGYCFIYDNGSTGINFYKSDDLSFLETSVDQIVPYEQTGTPLAITATSNGAPDNVTLWYRYSDDNATWSEGGAGASVNWWNESTDGTDWEYRKLITIDSGQIDATLTNFPVLVNISGDNDLASNSQSDKDDLVFVLYSDNNTVLNHEIENNGTSFFDAWVNVTSLSNTDDTLIWLYYGNLTCASQENITGVWDSNYIGVWHLHSDILDSTVYDFDGTADGAIDNTVAGMTGGATYFDGDCHIDTARDAGFGADAFTAEAWYKGTESSAWKAIMGQVDGSNGWAMINNVGSFNNWVEGTPAVAGVINNNVWQYCVMTRDLGTDGSMYLDSIYKADTVATTDVDSPTTFEIGGWGTDLYEGIETLDEIRLSNVQRSGAWVTATFNTITNITTFTTNGTEETYSAGGGGAGCEWRVWDNAANPDLGVPWIWNFNFPNSTGYYEFYSIGRKTGLTNESAPGSADTICYYVLSQAHPFMNYPFPVNNSFNQALTLIWNITIHDNDSLMDYTIQVSNGDSTADNDTGNGSKSIGIGGLSYYIKYKVWVNVTDAVNASMVAKEFFYFTTINITVFTNNVSTASNPIPLNESTDIWLMVTCNVTITDLDGNTSVCNFYRSMNCVDWAWNQTNSSVLNISISFNYTLSDANNTVYYWMVTCDDGNSNVSYWYSFTTVDALISITVIEFDADQLGMFLSLLLFMFFFCIGYFSPKRSGGGFMILAGMLLISLEALLIGYLSAVFVIPLITPFAIFVLALGIRKQFYPAEKEKTKSEGS